MIYTHLSASKNYICHWHSSHSGQLYYQDWFTGKRAWFTDSSDSEKVTYKQKLTFDLPDGTSELCGMHGKANSTTDPIRIHFSWPLNTDGKVYVVYIGDKITMR